MCVVQSLSLRRHDVYFAGTQDEMGCMPNDVCSMRVKTSQCCISEHGGVFVFMPCCIPVQG